MNIGVYVSFQIRGLLLLLLFSDIYPGVECLVTQFNFSFLRNVPTVFHSDCANLHSHQQCTKIPFWPHLWYHFLFVFFLMIAILTGMRWHFIVILICISLMGSWCWAHFHVPVRHPYIYFGKVFIQFFCPLLNFFFSFLKFLTLCFWAIYICWLLTPNQSFATFSLIQ